MAFLPAGDYILNASSSHTQGSPITAADTATIAEGTTTPKDIIMPEVGSISGQVRHASGEPANNARVYLSGAGGFYRQTYTDTAGQYTLTDVPIGDYTITTYEPVTGMTFSGPVSVTAGAAAPGDLRFIPSGKVTGNIYFADGATGIGSVKVDVMDQASGSVLKTAYTSSSGAYDTGYFASSASNFIIRASYTYNISAGTRTISLDQAVTGFTSNAQNITRNFTYVVNRGNIRARAYMSTGALFLGDSVRIEARSPLDNALLSFCNTSSTTAECTISNIVAGSEGVNVRAVVTVTTLAEKTVTFAASNDTVTVDLNLPIDPVCAEDTL